MPPCSHGPVPRLGARRSPSRSRRPRLALTLPAPRRQRGPRATGAGGNGTRENAVPSSPPARGLSHPGKCCGSRKRALRRRRGRRPREGAGKDTALFWGVGGCRGASRPPAPPATADAKRSWPSPEAGRQEVTPPSLLPRRFGVGEPQLPGAVLPPAGHPCVCLALPSRVLLPRSMKIWAASILCL